VLGSMLEADNISFDVAATAAAAKQLLAEKKYGALLLDLGLPDQDGLDLIQELKKDESTAYLPVIVVSARAEEGKVELNSDGFSVIDWIQKPIDKKRFKRSLNAALCQGGETRILHVEDSLDVVQIVKEIISDVATYQYVTTLKDARRLLDEQTFDLVIIDILLPDGSGLDLISEIDDKTRIIIFSGHDIDEDLNRHINASLSKSTTSNEHLLATIKRVISESGRINDE